MMDTPTENQNTEDFNPELLSSAKTRNEEVGYGQEFSDALNENLEDEAEADETAE